MKNILSRLKMLFSAPLRALKKFPLASFFSFILVLLSLVRIQTDLTEAQGLSFLLSSLSWSLAFATALSMAAVAFSSRRDYGRKGFFLSNLVVIAFSLSLFILLFSFSSTPSVDSGRDNGFISLLAAARVAAAMFISLQLFVLIISAPKAAAPAKDLAADQNLRRYQFDLQGRNYVRTLFILLQSAAIAAVYGLIIFIGASSLAAAVNFLLLPAMSSKVYGYIGVISTYIIFTVFLGQLPDIKKEKEQEWEKAGRQPRFIEILFGNVLAPIFLAFALVLLLWTGQTVAYGIKTSFSGLVGIVSTYSLGGIGLYLMLAEQNSKIAKIYRKVFPPATLLIHIVAFTVLLQSIRKEGIKYGEYWFILISVFVFASLSLFLTGKGRAYLFTAILSMVLAVLSVLPLIGYSALPAKSQIRRLEKILIAEEMLDERGIVPAIKLPDTKSRWNISDAVEFLAFGEYDNFPHWFKRELGHDDIFRRTFGFSKLWSEDDQSQLDYYAISFYLADQSFAIKTYDLAVSLDNLSGGEAESFSFEGENGLYQLDWTANGSKPPIFSISLHQEPIVEVDLQAYFAKLADKYPGDSSFDRAAEIEDMSVEFETEEASFLLLFQHAEIREDKLASEMFYWAKPKILLIDEKN